MLYELRIFRRAPGHGEQAVDGLRRFAATAFVEHGLRPLGFWLDEAAKRRPVDSISSRMGQPGAARCRLNRLGAFPAWEHFLDKARERGPAILEVSSRLMTALPDFETGYQHFLDQKAIGG